MLEEPPFLLGTRLEYLANHLIRAGPAFACFATSSGGSVHWGSSTLA